ncbi:MAG: hypothetical protein VKJ64_09380 [Leptolyngbyaceae bacterium]|nr:hypothetical protein [Leptolyngbyaceae bacterium]
MNVWLVTTGSSDVQLTSDENWSDWWQETKKSLYRLQFEPVRPIDDEGEPYRLHARVLGIAHDRLPEQVQPYLSFPLLQNFIQKLKVEKIQIDQIIVLTSDQENIFPESERETKRCPYWQDTCQLYPILEDYLGEYFPDATVKPLILKPKASNLGLDNWDAVLELVQTEIASLKFETEPQNIYVSHQAGTPAISSAVQFCSLAKFGDRVKFLVSSEQDKTLTDIIKSSTYLRGIKRGQSEKLLKNHDYTGVNDLIAGYLDSDTKILLDAAIQWNFSHFVQSSSLIKKGKKSKQENFLEKLSKHPKFNELVIERTGEDKWWWEAYEAAYLGVIRLRQGNTVEAVFHSFRSLEGLLKSWAEQKYPGELTHTKHPKWKENDRWDRNLRSYGEDLYTFLETKREINKDKNFDIWIFGNVVIGRRNELFHNIKGLDDQQDVFEVWRSSNEKQWKDNPEEKWKTRILNCLNYIVEEDFPDGFATLEEASLMAKVHTELENAIAHL